MEEGFVCECGNDIFWYFWGCGAHVRCTKCFNEYKRTEPEWGTDRAPEFWLRRFDKEKNQYHDNWEHSKITYKK